MIGIVFAAGIGSRLKPWTDEHPKALVPVGGKPMLGRVLDRLFVAGARGVVVNVHHFADQVRRYIAATPWADRIEISDESDLLLDTAGALARMYRCSRFISGAVDGEPIVVHNADILTDVDLVDMEERFISGAGAPTLLVDPCRNSSRHLLFDSDGRLHGWENTATGDKRPAGLDTEGLIPAAFGGVHVMDRDTMAAISASVGEPLHPVSIIDWYIDNCTTSRIQAYIPTNDYRWYDIGTGEKLARAEAGFFRSPF